MHWEVQVLKEIDKVEESGFEGYLGGAIDLLKDAAENSNLFRELY